MLTRRQGNSAAFAACAGALAYAFYAQYWQGFVPCHLCIFQRMALAATLICCGGIQNQAHLHRAFAAGADAVEIYTALARHGTRRLTELLFAGAAAL